MQRVQALLILFFGITFFAASPARGGDASTTFENLKALAGEWQGKKSEGQAVNASYKVISNGSAVVETLKPAEEPSMVTVYHLDGNHLRMAHYCAAGNQPRMKASPLGPHSVTFDFVDATNLAKPTDGHMNNLTIDFLGAERVRHKWTWLQNGEKQDNVFEFKRVK